MKSILVLAKHRLIQRAITLYAGNTGEHILSKQLKMYEG
jgi:hypothetical protein